MTKDRATNEAVVRLPMVCTCGEDRRKEADEMRKRVFTAIWDGHEPPAGVSEISNFFHALNYYGFSSTIYADMWFGVVAESYSEKYPMRISIQCDRVEDGVAAIVEYLQLHDMEID